MKLIDFIAIVFFFSMSLFLITTKRWHSPDGALLPEKQTIILGLILLVLGLCYVINIVLFYKNNRKKDDDNFR